MQTQNTGKFFVGSLVVFFILYLVVQGILANVGDTIKATTTESMAAEDVADRIKPVAEVTIGEEPVAVPAPAAEETTEVAAGGAGEAVVTKVCAMCHSTGMMSSPKLGSADDWAPRIDKGIDTLYNHALNGFNMMPARGGNPGLSDDEVKAAVDYMVSIAK
jgi:cytochrome c5